MRILLINPPHPSIGSRIPREHLPPLGLLSIGGPLIDARHTVQLLDAALGPMSTKTIVEEVEAYAPQVILIGHSGSTSAHPTIIDVTRLIKREMPGIKIIYGGVFPTFHWRKILFENPQIDIIVRGEGEATTLQLIHAIETNTPFEAIPGIAFRRNLRPISTPPAPLIQDLDNYRVGWELIDFGLYSYWGDRRAVVVQFSRGCPHSCFYCGQHGFWRQWRHRDPGKFAAELAWLYRTHGVEVINFADENPTSSRTIWLALLQSIISEKVPLTLVGSTRADDIVRDADLLHLYKKAGVARFLLGIESLDESTLKNIHKGGTTTKDREAIRLLRQHSIISMATYVMGFEEERPIDYLISLRKLLAYDPDQIQLLYITPHHWTPYYQNAAERRVIQMDIGKWDYKHQVLATRHMPPWVVLMWAKFIEAVMQLRIKSLWRLVAHPDPSFRAAMRWYYAIGRRVWLYEIWNFFTRDKRPSQAPKLIEVWGASNGGEEREINPHTAKARNYASGSIHARL